MINGWAGSGKDTMADFLVRTKNYVKENIADNLKRLVSEKYNIDISYFNSQEGKKSMIPEQGITARQLLIQEALKYKFNDPNFFIKKTHNELKLYNSLGYKCIVIPDFRYKQEYEYLSKFYPDIQTVNIKRFDSIHINDPSEKDLEKFIFDIYIDNKGTLEEFYSSVEEKINNPETTFEF